MTDYKDTIFLPQTSFSMKADLPTMEPKILAHWQQMSLYQKLRSQSQHRQKFVLHMGPPYANGHLHVGHALTGIFKDLVVRSHQMLGYDAPLVPGWDCHGLPIEWKIEEKYRKQGTGKQAISQQDFRAECRNFANHWIDVQRQESIRLGIQGDWDNPYITMAPQSEALIVETLFDFLEQGALYKGERPIMWSVVEKTALAEAEIEYHDHQSNAIFVAFPVISSPVVELQGASVLIWTTTPWSLPANRAVAYGVDISYAVIEAVQTVESDQNNPASAIHRPVKMLIATDLVDSLCTQLKLHDCQILHTIKGELLEHTICAHPLTEAGYDHQVPMIAGHHVTVAAGTGLVHIAPTHGPEDFELGRQYQLAVPDTITDDGLFRAWVPLFSGLHVFKADEFMIKALNDVQCLLHHEKITHSYPHSWRSKAPLIYRTTPQWFISMERTGLRDQALQAIQQTKWYPAHSQNRITSMVKNRPDWCLSRQRTWGIPLPLFIEKATGDVLNDPAVNKRIVEIFKQHGCEAWFERSIQEFLGNDYQASDYEQTKDILDVWFESGATQRFVLEARDDLQFPANVYLEGSDQHRGWFQSSLLIGCATRQQAPYKTVITHGFVLDEHGHKLSKSAGNALAPQTIIEKSGAEILRLWVAFSDYQEDSRIGQEILKHLEDIYRRFRNTLRYLLGALHEFKDEEIIDVSQMPELERWILHRLATLDELQRSCIADHNYQALITELHNFCALDLSAFYFDIRKDSVYCDHPTSISRRAVRTVFHHIFMRLIKWLAPYLCFTTEEAWLNRYPGQNSSVHLELFEELQPDWLDQALNDKITVLRNHRRLITGALEKARTASVIRSSLQASVEIFDPTHQLIMDTDYAELSIVSQITVHNRIPDDSVYCLPELPDMGVKVSMALGEKCVRCWKILEEVGKLEHHPNLCHRCCATVSA